MPIRFIDMMKLDLSNLAGSISTWSNDPVVIELFTASEVALDKLIEESQNIPVSTRPPGRILLASGFLRLFDFSVVASIRVLAEGHIDESLSNLRRGLEYLGAAFYLIRLSDSHSDEETFDIVSDSQLVGKQLAKAKIQATDWIKDTKATCSDLGAHGGIGAFAGRFSKFDHSIKVGEHKLESEISYAESDVKLRYATLVRIAATIASAVELFRVEVFDRLNIPTKVNLSNASTRISSACHSVRERFRPVQPM